METRSEKHLGINQLEALLSEQNLLELGWRPVPEVDGTHCKTWKEIGIQMERCGLASVSSGEWATEPLVITNQSLFKISHEFCKKLTTPVAWPDKPGKYVKIKLLVPSWNYQQRVYSNRNGLTSAELLTN